MGMHIFELITKISYLYSYLSQMTSPHTLYPFNNTKPPVYASFSLRFAPLGRNIQPSTFVNRVIISSQSIADIVAESILGSANEKDLRLLWSKPWKVPRQAGWAMEFWQPEVRCLQACHNSGGQMYDDVSRFRQHINTPTYERTSVYFQSASE